MVKTTQEINSIDSLYPLGELLGRGGGGIVYKSYDDSRRQNVVVKEILGDSIGLDNARREIDLLKNVKSTYLPQVYSFIQIRDKAYTIMEFVDGESLGKMLSGGRGMLENGFSQDECLRLFKELAEALRILHSADPPICHRDIKPDNVMLTQKRKGPDGNYIKDVCLIDFNVSSLIDGREESLIGYTEPYASPEQVMEAMMLREKWQRSSTYDENTDFFVPSVDSRSDIYSLGATMYHAITGVKPVGPLDGIQRDVGELSGNRLLLPFSRIIMKCMANRPEDRFQDAEELIKALDNVYRDTDEIKRLRRRQGMIRISLIAFALLGVGMIFAGILRIGQEKDSAYLTAVEEAADFRRAGDENGVNTAVNTAVKIYQTRPEAYIQKAEFLYEQGKYEEALQYLNEIALPYVENDADTGNLYLIAARSYREIGETDEACRTIEKGELLWPDNPVIIEEKAVILASLGRTGEAQALLDETAGKDYVSESIEYTRGEVALLSGDTDTAYKSFEKAVSLADDDYMKYRAYSYMIKILSDGPLSSDSIEKRIELTDSALGELSHTSYKEQIYQYRFQALIDKAGFSGEVSDASTALEEMKQYANDGNAMFDTWENMVSICREFGMYDEGKKLLDEMQKRYGEDYRIYADRAYLELSVQSGVDNSERDYRAFEESYLKAKELYDALSGNGHVDPGMENLSGLYAELLKAGWLGG